MTDYRAGKEFRLKHRKDIARVFDEGRRRSDARITLIAAANPQASHARVAVLVSKRHGPAVTRNRIKRLCREAFRLTRPELPGAWDYCILPRAGVVLTLGELQDSLRNLAAKAAAG